MTNAKVYQGFLDVKKVEEHRLRQSFDIHSPLQNHSVAKSYISVPLHLDLYFCQCFSEADVQVLRDDGENFKGLFLQDDRMKASFRSYPEIVFIDAKYKLLNLQLPVYIILCEDSNGQSEVVAVCLLVAEDKS